MFLKLLALVLIFVVSLVAVLVPLLQRLPPWVLFIAKHFGSGVIVCTGLIHLLEPASEALGDERLSAGWHSFPFAYGFCLLMIFVTFLGDLITSRKLAVLGIRHDHGGLNHRPGSSQPAYTLKHSCSSRDARECLDSSHMQDMQDDDLANDTCSTDPLHSSMISTSSGGPASELAGLLILELGVVLHSLFIGVSLAVAQEGALALTIALILHQAFEGLGLGARMTAMQWSRESRWIPRTLAWIYAVSTPLGIAIGLALQQTYDTRSTTANIITGVSDSLASGVLLYTGLVQLLSGEILHDETFAVMPVSQIAVAYTSTACGAFFMALLAIWV